jgi:hypothetical protein
MISEAIVVRPGGYDRERKSSVCIVVNVPTVDISVTITPRRLPTLNTFQKGVSYILLAGVKNVESISRLMGITDSDFVKLILSELKREELVADQPNGEYIATKKLRDEFETNRTAADGSKRFLCTYLPIDNQIRRMSIPWEAPLDTAPIAIEGRSTSVAIGTEGKPFVSECIVSHYVATDVPFVKSEQTVNWFSFQSTASAHTEVRVTGHAMKAFVIQCSLRESERNKPYPQKVRLFKKAVDTRFIGDNSPNENLANWVGLINERDPEFAQLLKAALWSGVSSEDGEEVHQELSKPSGFDEREDNREVEQAQVGENGVGTRVRTQVRGQKQPLAWLNQLLKARIGKLDLSRLQNSISIEKIEVRVALRLRELGSKNSNPAISPVNSHQFEAIVSNQLHDDFDLMPLLSVWILAESNTVISEIKDMRPEFLEDICTVASNPYAPLNRDARSAFDLVGEKN